MATQYLDKTGLAYFWGKIKDYISGALPTKTSDLTNDSGFIDSPNIPYLTCATAAGTAAKTTTLVSGTLPSTLTTGLQVLVKFTNSNSIANPTLAVGSLTAKSIKRYGTTAPSTAATTSWQAGSTILFNYDGTYWQMVDWTNTNTTYSTITDAEYQAGTSTSSRLVTPARLKAAILYHAPVKSVNGNTGDVTVTVPSNTSDLVNDSGFVTSSSLSPVATSGDYDDLTNTPVEPAVYVTQQGTGDGWTYRKWSDGTMEMWGTATDSTAANTSDGGGYRTAGVTPSNFPVSFTDVPIVNVSLRCGSLVMAPICIANPSTTSAGKWAGYRVSTNSNTAVKTFMFYCIGSWQ